MESTKPTKRSANICAECRARKVRCDGRRHVCSNCERLSLSCSFHRTGSSPDLQLERRRVRLACASCHSLKARCSGQLPKCQRCRTKGIECVYAPSKRASTNVHSGSHSLSDNGSASTSTPPERHTASPAARSGVTPYGTSFGAPPICRTSNVGRSHKAIALEESTVMLALDNFFKHIHPIPVYSFLHKASIIQRYEAGTVDTGLLLSIIGIASQLTDLGPGMREYGSECIATAESLVMRDIGKPSVIKIQSLILIIKHHKLCRRFTSAFMLLATAVRYAYALRLNYEASSLCFLAQESRRRLMWSLYILDSTLAGGIPDMILCSPGALYIQLPCQERNFEFDLEQETEPLRPPRPKQPLSESVGALGIYLRVMWIRARILNATKEAVTADIFDPEHLQQMIESFVEELDDIHASLPASFHFSEKNLHLRAYSTRLCPYMLIHIWWRQCYCDLFRITLAGLREALPRSKTDLMDSNFYNYCHWQCFDNAKALCEIFTACVALKSGLPTMDLDIHACAYQCARILFYTYRHHAVALGLTVQSTNDYAEQCLAILEHMPITTPAGDQMQDDLRKLIGRGPSVGWSTPSRPVTPVHNARDSTATLPLSDAAARQILSRHSIVKQMDLVDDSDIIALPARPNANIHEGDGTELDPIELQPEDITTDIAVEANPILTSPGQQAPPDDHLNFTAPNAFQGALDGFDFSYDPEVGDGFTWFPSHWGNSEFQAQSLQQQWGMQAGA